jgi:hypothetical protein
MSVRHQALWSYRRESGPIVLALSFVGPGPSSQAGLAAAKATPDVNAYRARRCLMRNGHKI